MKRGNTRRVNIKKLKQTEWINEEIKLTMENINY
jgi:hypothetical protein